MRKPKIGIFDIETWPMEVFAWSPKTEYIPHSQVKLHRAVASWAWKWIGSPKITYMDQRNAKDPRDDKKLLLPLRDLLNEAEIVVTKNGKRFDQRVIFGRMAINKILPPKPFQHEDVEQLFRKHFDLPYYNMDFLSDIFCKEHKKSSHKRFPGMNMWIECLAGNKAAWREMEHYNKKDVLVTEELRGVIIPWGPTPGVSYDLFSDRLRCRCGSLNLIKRGMTRLKSGNYPQFSCNDCGAWHTKTGAKNKIP